MEKQLLLLFTLSSFCSYAAIVKQLRGEVSFEADGISATQLKFGQSFTPPGTISTKPKSFVRIKLENGHHYTIGPNSIVYIEEKEDQSPRTLSLLKGQVRAQISKGKDERYKAFIKTKSASLGVRGTDFLVTYNDDNKITSTVTFKGEVNLYKRPDDDVTKIARQNLNLSSISQKEIINELNSGEASSVKQAEFSGSFPSYDTTTDPVKISQVQYAQLIKNNALRLYPKSKSAIKAKAKNEHLRPRPETQEDFELDDKVRSGGYLDLETGIYINPPANAQFDPMTKTYVMPSELGGVDPRTGNYLPPKNLKLHPTRGFVLVDKLKEGVENLSKLRKRLNRTINTNLRKFKSITAIDAEGRVDYFYDSNVMNQYYLENRDISQTPSQVLLGKGSLGRHLYQDKNYYFYPKVEGSIKYHNRRTEPEVKKKDRATFKPSFQFSYFTKAFDRRYEINNRVAYRYESRDFRARNQLDFFIEDFSYELIHKFYFTSKHITEFGYRYTFYEGRESSETGVLNELFIKHHLLMGRRYNGKIEFSVAQRDDNQDDELTDFFQSKVTLERKNLFRKMNAYVSAHYQMNDPQYDVNYTQLKYYGARLELKRRKGEYLIFNLFYDWNRQKSRAHPNLRFKKQTLGAGLEFIF